MTVHPDIEAFVAAFVEGGSGGSGGFAGAKANISGMKDDG